MDFHYTLLNIKTDTELEVVEDVNCIVPLKMEDVAPTTQEQVSSTFDIQCDNEQAIDPLMESQEMLHTKQSIRWECNEMDFFNTSIESLAHQNESLTQQKRNRKSTEFWGRNGFAWNTDHSAITQLNTDVRFDVPKVKGPARHVRLPIDAWQLFIDEPILAHIVKHTNDHIQKLKEKESFKRCTDMMELRAWIGLNYLCGIFRNSQNCGPLLELWTVELGNTIFRATMSLKRYQFLSECIRFADSKEKLNSNDIISEIWEKFIINCRSYYAPSSYCVIDEHIVPLSDSNCPFQYHTPKHLSISGLRFVTLCDAKTLYLCNALFAKHEKPLERDIFHLVADIKGTQRNICLSDRYTSVVLFKKLLDNKLTTVGALPHTAPELPKECLGKNMPVQCLHDAGGLTLYTGLQDEECDTGFILSSNSSTKINAKKLFITTSKSCQRMQCEAATYSTFAAQACEENNWTQKFFSVILNYAALNAWIVSRLSENVQTVMDQRDFQRQLGLLLTTQHLKRRLYKTEKLPLVVKLQIADILGVSAEEIVAFGKGFLLQEQQIAKMPVDKLKFPDGVPLMPKYHEHRLRCRKCPSKTSTKTRTRCQQCQRPLCARHLVFRCAECTGLPGNTLDMEGDRV